MDIPKIKIKSEIEPRVEVINRGKKRGTKQFGGKSINKIISDCKTVWAIGGTDNEASFYAGISDKSLSRYIVANPDIRKIRDSLKNKPILKARQEVVRGLEKNPHFSLKYLERKKKDEFSLRTEHSNPDGSNLNDIDSIKFILVKPKETKK